MPSPIIFTTTLWSLKDLMIFGSFTTFVNIFKFYRLGHNKEYSVLIQTCIMRAPQTNVVNIFLNENCYGSYL